MKTIHVSYGTNCRDSNSQLIYVEVSQVLEEIKSNNGLAHQIKVLRSIKRYSEDRYRSMKASLPFFSCSLFDPPRRILKNFKSAIGLIIDIDWKVPPPTHIKDNLIQDPRIYAGYVSPGGIGLKIIFLFETPISDAIEYSKVYKRFTSEFAKEYNLLDAYDPRNSDACRISFLSFDPGIIINDDPVLIDYFEYLCIDVANEQTKEGDIPPDVYKTIMQKLNTRPKIIKPEPILSNALSSILPLISEVLDSYTIKITEKINIQSGIKLVLSLGSDLGEVNVYHGKKGYSVISSPKKGTNPILNESAKRIIESILPLRFK